MASKFSAFMKQNYKKRSHVFVAACEELCDADGKPLEWELRPLSSKEIDRINNMFTTTKTKKNGQTERKTDYSKISEEMMIRSIVVPDLLDAELQDSYGVKTPNDLLHEILEDPGEYNALLLKIQEINHIGKTLESRVQEAKN